MNRRKFIQQSIATSTLISLGGLGFQSFNSKPNTTHITILHTNDVHSHIDPFGPEDSRNANKGGIARRASLIEFIRQENPNTILLDAGDIFQGTPYFNYYGGELEFKLMSKLKYDLATIGNHDFDNGIDGLYAQLPNADFEFVSANYDFRNTLLDSHVKPYKILNKSGIKIGIFGLGIKLKGLVDPVNFKETQYLDPVEIAQDITRILKQEHKCNIVICLSHLGYAYNNEPNKISDTKLATQTKDIDLIIGGHTHTFLPKPTIHKNIENRDVIINQVGCYGLYLGRIDFYFDTNKTKSTEGISITV
ncbi:bifunctional metallophosphatase/5'-nucleotidase [Gaetbulibacter saemankumensis]|uniref:bifunctional metallophosphatase/5'-nucleotidase n=1 Tax=Gaetbulibacter saemankumensis TaxID=311208 RepID=UPI0004199C14|nr:metallophosphatase [Gaetbulibacter saemankumensis]